MGCFVHEEVGQQKVVSSILLCMDMDYDLNLRVGMGFGFAKTIFDSIFISLVNKLKK